MNSGEHPAEALEASVRVAQRRASIAMGALVATALVRLYNIPVRLWQSGLIHDVQAGNSPGQEVLAKSDSLVQVGAVLQLVILVVTAVTFLMWLHRTVKLTRALGGDTLRHTPRDAMLGFIVPFWNIQRPYHIVRDVHDHLAPDAVPEPPVQVRAEESMGYRQVAMIEPPPPMKLPHASIGAWWGFFWVSNIISNVASRQHGEGLDNILLANMLNNIADGVDIVAASLGVLMVRGVNARLQERFRRIRHNSPEALQAAGIEVSELATGA